MVRVRNIGMALMFLLPVWASGCGKSYPGGEKLHPVTITVLESGRPFDGAVVILIRQEGEKLNTSGLTDELGKAAIMVDSEWQGAPAGKYMVKISKDPPFTPDLSPEEEAKLNPNEYSAYQEKMVAKRLKLKPVVPEILSSEQSPFTIEVTSGTNEKTFDIVTDLK